MPSFITRLTDGWERAQYHLPLALVPLITASLNSDKISKVIAFNGVHFGLKVGLPMSVVDLWQFVSVPNSGVNVALGGPVTSGPLVFIVFPLALVLQAGLAAGYFGSIRDVLATDSYRFGENARRYFLPFLLYTVVPVLLMLPLVLLGVGTESRIHFPLVVLLIPAFFLLAYLFYATPYLIVLHETEFISAARASYALAIAGGPYFAFAGGFAGFVLGGSLLATAVVVNLGLIGVVFGVIIAAPVGLVANIATMRFISEIDDESSSVTAWTTRNGGSISAGDKS